MLDAISKELILQKDYLNGADIETIYFGGGTPSVLTINDLDILFKTINNNFNLKENLEITLEANPDDLNSDYLSDLKKYTPVNRLSIGIQSFSEDDLLWMNRAHNAIEARACIEYAQDAGFDTRTSLNGIVRTIHPEQIIFWKRLDADAQTIDGCIFF